MQPSASIFLTGTAEYVGMLGGGGGGVALGFGMDHGSVKEEGGGRRGLGENNTVRKK